MVQGNDPTSWKLTAAHGTALRMHGASPILLIILLPTDTHGR